MTLLRFHWDFLGPDAEGTAEHFVKHVHEFCEREGIGERRAWHSASGARWTASLECEEKHMLLVRDRLRPKRAERVNI